MMRRYYLRLFRVRNLVVFTAVLILIYVYKIQRTTFKLLSEVNEPLVTTNKIAVFVPKSHKKIDWHDHAQIAADLKRIGTGEQGRPAYLPEENSSLEESLYAVNGFNGALSDLISLNRSLPDIRHDLCIKKQYIESLPTVSVVVPFHNEHWTTLLRTAISVIGRSPKHLLKEILLVDDASTKGFLKEPLDEYLAKFVPKTRAIRLPKRSGLITARLAGAREATADVLVFLDSHTEANVNWLPPLLEPIAFNYRTAVCPYIDVVAYDTFEYRAQDQGARGAFDWEFFYKRLPVLPKDELAMPEPFASPVMAGGLFAISRAFFWELGGYDPGLDIWGGEQYELSFKIWQCGGRMLDAPCSRVGHIYRKFAPFPNPNHGDFVAKNYRRVAEVWMDEYAQYLYNRRPHYRNIDPGDISDQKALRKKLKCKSFRWFMTQVAFDLTAKYPVVEPDPYGDGRIRPLARQNLCLDAHHGNQGDILILSSCVDSAATQQLFVLSWHKDIKTKHRSLCWDLPESAPGSHVLLYTCHLGGGNQEWRYDLRTKQIRKSYDVCLDWEVHSREVYVQPCSLTKDTQRWTVEHLDAASLANWSVGARAVTGPEVDDWYNLV